MFIQACYIYGGIFTIFVNEVRLPAYLCAERDVCGDFLISVKVQNLQSSTNFTSICVNSHVQWNELHHLPVTVSVNFPHSNPDDKYIGTIITYLDLS